MFNKLFFLCMLGSIISCAPYAFQETSPSQAVPHITHSFELVVCDVKGDPLEGATVIYKLEIHGDVVNDTIVVTPLSGKVADSLGTTSYLNSPVMIYEVAKDGYYSQFGHMRSIYDRESNKNKSIETKTVILLNPNDYFQPAFISSPKWKSFQVDARTFINSILVVKYLSDSYLETQSIDLVTFKEQDYLACVFNSTNVYNSLQLDKYDICKKLFDEVIREAFNPLNNNFVDVQEFYGYDLTVYGFTKSFVEEYARSEKIVYRFLISKDVVSKYELKDISGQQVLDASIILMDDERIELKLQ